MPLVLLIKKVNKVYKVFFSAKHVAMVQQVWAQEKTIALLWDGQGKG